MKKIILLLTIGLLFISCSSSSNDSPSSSSSGVYKWRFKLDGVLYEWQGNHLTFGGAIAAGGQSTYVVNTIALQKTNGNGIPFITVGIIFPTASTGNFVFNSSSDINASFLINFSNDNLDMVGSYSSAFGGTMNVNITSLSNVTFLSNPTNPGKVIGTFSGTIMSYDNNSTVTITDGYFEAGRGS